MTRSVLNARTCILTLTVLLAVTAAMAGDWPMWRHDAGRTAAAADALPSELHLLWVRQYSPRTPVWEDTLNRDLMPYDRVFEPVVAGKRLFLGFNDSDKVVALSTDTGEEDWAFYADGPVRFPPVVWQDSLFFVSDDGCLYCLNTKNGEMRWKLRGGPDNRQLLGNSRLISTWPARGGPVVADGVVYFAAGIWPFMGTFMYAVDAATGDVLWLNDGDGPTFQEQPHGGAWSFGGVAPQGAFAVSGDTLLVPGGRSVPAALDRQTGKMRYYRFHEINKTGGAFVCADGSTFFNHHRERVVSMFDVATGERTVFGMGKYPVLAGDTYYMSGDTVRAFDSAAVKADPEQWQAGMRWEIDADASGDLVKAGDCLYAAGDGRVAALKLDSAGQPPRTSWVTTVDGNVERLAAADGKLFAVTLDGRVMAFGAKERKPRQILERPLPPSPSTEAMAEASELLDRTKVTEGYALFFGAGDGQLLEALAALSDLHIVAFERDPRQVARLRRHFDAIGLYGSRVSVRQGDPFTVTAPPYLASLTLFNETTYDLDAGLIDRLYPSMRPYGGVVWLRGADQAALAPLAETSGLHGLKAANGLLVREGPLQGAGQWTHLLGDIAQTGKAADERVRLPLGLLWFGGNTHEDVLTRHGHGPPEQVVNGRLIIEGMDCMSARDVYTGRVLWRVPMNDLGTYGVYFDETYKDTPTDPRYNQVHIPGANMRGTNFVATADGVYVIQGGTCSVLDPVTGATLRTISLPHKDPEARRPKPFPWGYIGAYEDLLIAGADFADYSDLLNRPKAEYSIWEDFDKSASKRFFAMDRATGTVLWTAEANHGFLHNGTAAGNGLLFSLDKLPPHITALLGRRGIAPPDSCRLVAHDIKTGDVAWETAEGVFGSFLCYSPEHDILLQSTRPGGDSPPGEDGHRLIAYRGKTGNVLWDKMLDYKTFPLLYGDRFITESGIYLLATCEPVLWVNPLTGQEEPWQWRRMYGCNYPIASEHLLTFRSGAAGFYDLAGQGGTGNFGGFKSSCTSNLVCADGVLNAPDYTRTCSCSYQNQTSLALTHMPDVETWTFNDFKVEDRPIERVGINLGAPGDRRADNGTLWLDYPVGQSPSPDIQVTVAPEDVNWRLHHSSRFTGEQAWVAASYGEGVTSVTIPLAPNAEKPRPFTVRLFFAEPESMDTGKRVFDVALQGDTVLADLDIAREAGAPRKSVIREFKGVLVKDRLVVTLSPSDSAAAPPILCGVEAVLEEQ
jgi:outer membrane protein assembly factor BamB